MGRSALELGSQSLIGGLMKALILIAILTVCIKGLLYYTGPGVDVPTLVIEDGKPVVCEVRA